MIQKTDQSNKSEFAFSNYRLTQNQADDNKIPRLI